MVTFRCTQRVCKRFKLAPEEEPPSSTGLLGDWYANLLNHGRLRLVLCVNETSFLPVLVRARKEEFPGKFPELLFRQLLEVGVDERAASKEASSVKDWSFGKTRSRVVLGVMNDFSHIATHSLDRRGVEGTAVALASMITGPLDYGSPGEKTREVLGGVKPRG